MAEPPGVRYVVCTTRGARSRDDYEAGACGRCGTTVYYPPRALAMQTGDVPVCAWCVIPRGRLEVHGG